MAGTTYRLHAVLLIEIRMYFVIIGGDLTPMHDFVSSNETRAKGGKDQIGFGSVCCNEN